MGLNNGQSEVWGSTDQNILQGAPAIAYTYGECWWFFGVIAKINEGDVIFDYGSPWQWTPTRSKSTVSTYNGSLRLIQGTALHELGHAAGLMHENRYYNIMGADFTHLDTQVSTVNAYVGEDAGNGLVSLYGVSNSKPQDIAVAHWRRIGASGEYSTHGRTRIFNTTGTELSRTTVSNEPQYNVTKGNQVQVEFTYENVGRSTINNAVVNYYLSTNDNITTFDTLIGTTTMNIARDLPNTINRTITIPSNLVSGSTFWLGVIMNMPAGISDGDTSNNTSYIRVRIN